MTRRKAFKTNWELYIARADDVLDLEIRELGVEAKLLDDPCVFARRQTRVLEKHFSTHEKSSVALEEPTILGFSTGNHHLARSKD